MLQAAQVRGGAQILFNLMLGVLLYVPRSGLDSGVELGVGLDAVSSDLGSDLGSGVGLA